MQGQSINTPLDLSTHLTYPFENANETKTAEVKFCAYLRPSLSNEDQRVSRLTDRENDESWNCDKALSSYNQTYADTLLNRQLQDEESNSLEWRVDALINKRDLMNHSKKLTFNSHYMQTQYDHKQTLMIDHRSYDSDKNRRQKHRRHCHKSLMNVTMQSRYPMIMVVMATHLLVIMVVAPVEIQRYLVYITVLLVEQMDKYLGSVHKCSH